MNRAGIKTHNGKRREGHEEDILLELFKVLEHFDENNAFCQENVVERLDILVAVLNGNTIAEAYCLDLVIAEPLREESMITISPSLTL